MEKKIAESNQPICSSSPFLLIVEKRINLNRNSWSLKISISLSEFFSHSTCEHSLRLLRLPQIQPKWIYFFWKLDGFYAIGIDAVEKLWNHEMA